VARFPLLGVAGRRYLAVPATSVPTEHALSSAGDICLINELVCWQKILIAKFLLKRT